MCYIVGIASPRDNPQSPVSSPFTSLHLSGLSNLQDLSSQRSVLAASPTHDTEALIRVELDIISPNCPTNASYDETLQIANIQFNNLDFVGKYIFLYNLFSCFNFFFFFF